MPKSPFIPAALDEADLDVYAFRVLCRVARRGRCTERAKSMAEGCGIGVDTVRDRLKMLTERGYLSAEKRQGQTTVYTVSEPEDWDAERATPTDENPRVQDPKVSEPYGSDPHTPTDENPRDPTDQTPTPYKGTPSKVLPKGNDDDDAARGREALSFLPDDHEWLREDIASHLAELRAGTADAEMIARRLLSNGTRQQFPKHVIVRHMKKYPPPEFVAAWTIAANNATTNPAKYADTILEANFEPRHGKQTSSRDTRDESYSESFERIFRAASEA